MVRRYMSRDSVVCIAIGHGLDGRGSIPGRRNYLHSVETSCGTHPTSCPLDTGGFFPGVKQPGRVADHSPTSSAMD
jgi:hypothetical protein